MVYSFPFHQKKLKFADYLHNFELFYRSICNIDNMLNESIDIVTTKIKDVP